MSERRCEIVGDLPPGMPEALRRSCVRQSGPGEGAFWAVTLAGICELAIFLESSSANAMVFCLERGVWPLRFARNRGSYSAEDQIRLLRSHAVVVGLGGLGGHAATLLARAGVGTLTLCDGDFFDESNLNRQALCREDSLGRNKALAAQAELARIAAHAATRVFPENAHPGNVPAILEGADVVLDCLDSLDARRTVEDAAHAAGVPFVHGAIAGDEGFVAVSAPGRSMLRNLYGEAEAAPKEGAERRIGVPAPTAAALAAVQAALAIRSLIGRCETTGLAHMDLSIPAIELLE